MCGRISVDGQIQYPVTQQLKIPFSTETNLDLRPTQPLSMVTAISGELTQLQASWGIKRPWAKNLLINSQAETVAVKPTFKQAFASRRCLIPCSGFYEWRAESGAAKQKYYFHHAQGEPLYMAGIWYPGGVPSLVTLTTEPGPRMRGYHHRCPVFISAENICDYLCQPAAKVVALLTLFNEGCIAVQQQ